MGFKLKPLNEQVLVITGASSGIGLATAREAADRGARLVLVSRNDEALSQIAQQINDTGGQAMHMTADVARREELQAVADAAIARFGGFDTWINNAGLSIFGRLEEVTEEDHRRLFDINFWGIVNGSLIAAQHLKNRGGAIINLGSVASDVAFPLQGMYCASKHAIKGFTDALRMELESEGAPVSVTLIKPAGINTPFPQHARKYTAQEPKIPPPMYPAEEVAHAILHACSHRERDIYVGGFAKVMSTLSKHAPRAVDWVGERMLSRQQLRDEPARDREGSLHRPGGGGRIKGDDPTYTHKTSLYTRASLHPVWTGAVVAAALGVAAAALLGTETRRRTW